MKILDKIVHVWSNISRYKKYIRTAEERICKKQARKIKAFHFCQWMSNYNDNIVLREKMNEAKLHYETSQKYMILASWKKITNHLIEKKEKQHMSSTFYILKTLEKVMYNWQKFAIKQKICRENYQSFVEIK